MKSAELKRLVKNKENESLEFKSSTASLNSGFETICAFLNKNGGHVIFGAKDNGDLIGQDVSAKTLQKIHAEINKIEPRIDLKPQIVTHDDKLFVIVLSVDQGENQPYLYDGRAYIRRHDETHRMSREEFTYLSNKSNPTIWEKVPSEYTLKELDKSKIKELARIAVAKKKWPDEALDESVPQIAQRLELIKEDRVINAAIILFCKNKSHQYTQANIKLARFKGIDKSSFSDSKQFKGNVFELLDQAMQFLDYHIPVAARIEEGNWVRIETPAIPDKVLREAVINALIHRDYSLHGGSTTIAIYNDRVEIVNIGNLPTGIKLAQLEKRHTSVPRNPIIVKALHLMGKIEAWGRGTNDIINLSKKAGNPAPIFEEIDETFSVTLPFKVPIQEIIEEGELTVRQTQILRSLEEAPLKTIEIIKKLNLDITVRSMQRELLKLKANGFIKSEGSTRALIWILKK